MRSGGGIEREKEAFGGTKEDEAGDRERAEEGGEGEGGGHEGGRATLTPAGVQLTPRPERPGGKGESRGGSNARKVPSGGGDSRKKNTSAQKLRWPRPPRPTAALADLPLAGLKHEAA